MNRRTSCVLQAKDYVTLKLTGRRCIDPSDASGTNAYDQHTGDWSDEMLAAGSVDRSVMPEILPSASVAGEVTSGAAAASGLRAKMRRPSGVPGGRAEAADRLLTALRRPWRPTGKLDQ